VSRPSRLWLIAAAVALLASTSAEASTISGSVDDSSNTALVGSDLGLPNFASDAEIAENVALYEFTVTAAGTFAFDSVGFAAGGAEPYFSIFAGSGTGATFLASNFLDPSIDFSLTQPLIAGTYMLAVGVWENLSFAENLGAGTLGDGFTRLGDPSRLGSAFYEIDISSTDGAGAVTRSGAGALGPAPIPEPGTMLLFYTGLAGFGVTAWRRRRG
jgi:hypothetical protein